MSDQAQPQTVPSGPESLLATKLHVPGSRPGLVPRPRLAQRLDEGLEQSLVLVCAPAGYGKTVLLADWARRNQNPAAWLSLDAGDNDPARFWRHAVAALDRVRPGIGARAEALLGPPAPPTLEPLLAVLINELAAASGAGDALLVLDDYHLIQSAAVHESLEFLVEHRPPGLCLVLASRSDPPLALARLRARGLLTEVRAAELRFTEGEAAALLRQAAAAWCAAQGLPDDAIRHALAAGETTWAARLIEQHFDAVFYLRGEQATIQRWLAGLPGDLVQSRPRLLLAQTTVANAGGRLDTVEPLIDAAERAAAGGGTEEPFEPTVGRAASMLANVPALIALDRSYLAQFRDDTDGTAEFAAAALELSEPGEWLLRSIAQGFLAVAQWRRGRLADAESAFASSIAGWRAASQPTVTAWGGYQLATVQREQGRLGAVVRTCRQTLETTAPRGRPPLPAAGPAYVALADVAYQRDDLDEALRYATEGIELCRQFVYGPPLAAGLVTLARVRQATGDPDGAMTAMDEAGQVVLGSVSQLNPVPAQLVRLQLAQGDLAGAARWSQESWLTPSDAPDYAHETGHLVLARVLLAQGEPGQALALLGRLHEAATAQDRAGSLVEIGALQALALAAVGDHDAALTALAGALAVACPEGFVRVFADEGQPMAALTGQLLTARRAGLRSAAGVPGSCLGRIQRALDAGPAAPGTGRGSAGVAGLVEQLTARELQVLQMLAAGLSNQAIARELVVTLDTVKKHVSHVLGKLSAANRTEAVSLARDLGLIP